MINILLVVDIMFQDIIAPVEQNKFDIEIALEKHTGVKPTPFSGLDSTHHWEELARASSMKVLLFFQSLNHRCANSSWKALVEKGHFVHIAMFEATKPLFVNTGFEGYARRETTVSFSMSSTCKCFDAYAAVWKFSEICQRAFKLLLGRLGEWISKLGIWEGDEGWGVDRYLGLFETWY